MVADRDRGRIRHVRGFWNGIEIQLCRDGELNLRLWRSAISRHDFFDLGRRVGHHRNTVFRARQTDDSTGVAHDDRGRRIRIVTVQFFQSRTIGLESLNDFGQPFVDFFQPIAERIFALAANDPAFHDLELIAIGIEHAVARNIQARIDAKDSCFAVHEVTFQSSRVSNATH